MKKKRILISAYCEKNLGDDLFLKVLFDRYKNVEWYLLTHRREYNQIFEQYKNVNVIKFRSNRFYRLSYNFININKYDALIYIGGSIFMQFEHWKTQLKERQYFSKKLNKKGKKIFVMGANFGPYKNENFIEEYKELFREYKDICFRDKYSYNLFKNMKNVRVAPDVVFSLDKNKLRFNKDNIVGFSIINLDNRKELSKYEDKYISKINSFITTYINLGYKIRMFSFCEEEGDIVAINKVLSNIKDSERKNIEIISYDGKINDFLIKFAECDTIIGTRFHSIILSQLFDQNVYPFIYSEKTYNTLVDINLDRYYTYIKDIGTINVNEIVEKIQGNKVKDFTYINKSEEQFKELDLFLNNYIIN